MVECNGSLPTLQCATVRGRVRAQCQSAPDCPVPLEDKTSNGQMLQNPNGWVTWLAHRTIRCAHRQQPAPTVVWWLRAINTPNHHHHHKHPSFLSFSFNTRASAFTHRHNSKDQSLSKSQIQLKHLVTCERDFCVLLSYCLLDCLLPFSFPFSSDL
jgi:hypothetical protein